MVEVMCPFGKTENRIVHLNVYSISRLSPKVFPCRGEWRSTRLLQPIDGFSHCRASKTLKSISAVFGLIVGQTLFSDKFGVSLARTISVAGLGEHALPAFHTSETATLRQIEQVRQIEPGILIRFLK